MTANRSSRLGVPAGHHALVALILISLTITTITAPTLAEDCVDYSDHLRWLANAEVEGFLQAIIIDGPTAYVTSRSQDGSPNQLLALDLTDPIAPAVIGSLTMPYAPTFLVQQDDMVYVACGGTGGTLALVDVSDPAQLQLLGTVGMYAVTGVTVSGSYAYFTNGYSPLFIADISDPTAPELLGWASTGGIGRGTAVLGNTLYVADSVNGLVVIDVADPAAPEVVDMVPTPGMARGITLVGDQLYVAMGSDGVCVYDVSDPWQPVMGVAVPVNHLAMEIVVADDQAFVVDRNTGVVVLDVSEPTAPEVLGTIDSYSYVTGVAVADGRAYLTAYITDLAIFDYPGPGPVTPLGWSLEDYHDIVDLALVDGMAVMLAGNPTNHDGLRVLDIADPRHPLIVGALGPDFHGRNVVAGEHCVYVKSFAYFDIIDLSVPENPTLVTRLPLISASRQMERSGNLVFIAAAEDGVQVVDVSDPADPFLRITLPAADSVRALQAHEGMVYVADGAVLDIYAFNNPDAPIVVNSVVLPFPAAHLDVDQGMVYASGYGQVVAIIDVSPPTTPAVVGQFSVQRAAANVTASEGLVYVADSSVGFHVFDVADPTDPVMIGSCDTPGQIVRMIVTDDVVCAAMGPSLGGDPYIRGGLVLLPRQCVTPLATLDHLPIAGLGALQVYPNPFNPRTTVSFAIDQPQNVELCIFDLTGKRIAVLADRVFRAGTHSVDWQGKDLQGRAVASGTYLMRVVTDGGVTAEKMMLIR